MTTVYQLKKRLEALETDLSTQQTLNRLLKLKPSSEQVFLDPVINLSRALSREQDIKDGVEVDEGQSVEEAKTELSNTILLHGLEMRTPTYKLQKAVNDYIDAIISGYGIFEARRDVQIAIDDNATLQHLRDIGYCSKDSDDIFKQAKPEFDGFRWNKLYGFD